MQTQYGIHASKAAHTTTKWYYSLIINWAVLILLQDFEGPQTDAVLATHNYKSAFWHEDFSRDYRLDKIQCFPIPKAFKLSIKRIL